MSLSPAGAKRRWTRPYARSGRTASPQFAATSPTCATSIACSPRLEKTSVLSTSFLRTLGPGSLLPLGLITEQQVDDTFAANVKGVVFTVQGALTLLRAGGSVILNASAASIKGTPGFSIYSASKAAVRNLARSWIIDLRDRGIRVNVVSPGVVPTPGYNGLGLSAEDIQAFIDLQVKTIPLGRIGMTDEIAKVVTFLASDDSSFINGVELFVDGGMTQI